MAQLALQRRRFSDLTDDDFRWVLQQIDARQRLASKLPSLVSEPDFWWPVRLSCEQCSSELTARYKAALISSPEEKIVRPEEDKNREPKTDYRLMDLTGGLGIDTLFLASVCSEAHYVERDPELCRLAAHNFALPLSLTPEPITDNRNPSPPLKGGRGDSITEIHIHNTTAEDFLSLGPSPLSFNLYYLDPARRDANGSKVFRLSDCTPDVTALVPVILSKAPDASILLKLSPMLDISSALRDLTPLCTPWQVHVLSVRNEVKEVLLYHTPPSQGGLGVSVTALDLPFGQPFVFTPSEEQSAVCTYAQSLPSEPVTSFLYEPAAAILKAGAFRLVGARYGLQKLDPNTHLYFSDTLISGFPGRVFRIESQIANPKAQLTNLRANVIARNYPLTADQLRRKFSIRDGGDLYLIGTRLSGKPLLLTATRL